MTKSQHAGTPNDPAGTPIHQHSVSRRDFLGLAGLTGLGGASLALGAPAAQASAAQTSSTNGDRTVGWLCWDGDGDVYTPFIFEPSFFATSSMKYNPHLATFGCCVALASFNADGNGGADGSYSNEQRNIRSLLNQIGMGSASDAATAYNYQCDGYRVEGRKAGNVAWNSYYEEKPNFKSDRDPQCSIGLCAGWRRIKVSGKNYNLVVMGIRGGNYGVEWAGNLTAGETGNHKGFQEAADQASRFLKAHIREWGLSGKTKILICGYSRAAATANLTAGNIVRYAIEKGASRNEKNGYYLGGYFSKQIEIYQSDLYAYCYEAPAGVLAESDADKTAVHKDYSNIHSIINPCDLVPKVMPSAWNFTRYGVDKLLPGPADRALYLKGRDNMRARQKAISLHKKNGKEFNYTLDTFPAIDFTILGGIGQKLLKLWDMTSLDIFMENFFNSLATQGIPARTSWTGQNKYLVFKVDTECDGYARKFQPALVDAILLFDTFSTDPLMTEKDADKKTPTDKLISKATGLFSDKLLIAEVFGCLATGYALSFLTSKVESVMKEVSLSNGQTVYERYGARVSKILSSILEFDYFVYEFNKLIGSGTMIYYKSVLSIFLYDHIQEIVAFAQKSDVIISAHLGDLVLAWMQSLDSYYNTALDGDIEGAPDLETVQAQVEALALDDAGDAASVDDSGEIALLSADAADEDAEDEGENADEDEEADEEEVDDSTADFFVNTYRKVIFDGNAAITYEVNGQNYPIFENGKPVYDDGEPIKIEGKECPFTYGLNSNLQQVVLLPDSPNDLDGSTKYVFRGITEPDVPLKCALARYEKLGSYPTKAYVYDPAVGHYDEPLTTYMFEFLLNKLDGQATSDSAQSGEGFSCDLTKPGFEWGGGDVFSDETKGDEVAARYCDIEAISSSSDMGYTAGGGIVLRGTYSRVVAVPNDGYEFDYWTVDDKWMVNGEQASFKYWVERDDEGNVIEPDIPEGEWVEGAHLEGEMFEDNHVIQVLADDYHLVRAHFKATATDGGDGDKGGSDVTPDATPDSGADGSGNGNSDGTGNGGNGSGSGTAAAKKGKDNTPSTGDSTFSAAVGVAAAAGIAAVVAGSMVETDN